MNNNIEKWRAEIDAIDDELWNRVTIVGCGLVGGSFRGGFVSAVVVRAEASLGGI